MEVLGKSLPLLLNGMLVTLLLSVASTAVATLVGAALALLQSFGNPVLRFAVETYLYLVRGIPLLVMLFGMYYALPYVGITVEPMTGGVLVIGIYFGAFMTEVFRAAILAVPKGQWEAGRAIGMRTPAVLLEVVLGQALRMACAPYINTVIMVVKGTSLVAVIGVADITFIGRNIVERTLEPFIIFGAVAFAYFAICYSLSLLGRYFERRVAYVN